MNKEKLLEFIEKNRNNFGIQLKRLHSEIYNQINETQSGETFGEKMYKHIGGEIGKCEACGAETKFNSYYKGYRNTCSYKCLNSKKISKPIVKTCPVCITTFETDKRHNRVTCSAVCQTQYIAKPEFKNRVQEKLVKTMQEKYGVSHPSHLPDFAQKLKATKKEKYGDENFVNPHKAKQTKLDKYGSVSYNNSEKLKTTCLEKYGVDNPSKFHSFIKKANETKLEKFGKNMISDKAMDGMLERLRSNEMGYQSDNFAKTMVSRYGSANAMQVPSISAQAIKTTHDKFYASLLDGRRIGDLIIPKFSREEYVGTRGPNDERIFYQFACKKCNHEFSAVIEDGAVPSCPICFPPETSMSKPENEVCDFIRSILPNTEIVRNTRSVISPYELDIYIPVKQVAIEFNGMIWHSENFGKKEKKYHLKKTDECVKKNIRLIHVFESEWVNKRDIVKRKIARVLGINLDTGAVKIFARKCTIKEISSKESSEFLTQWHIQGKDNARIRFGAYHGEKLVACMTFGAKRIALGSSGNKNQKEYEMYRFCVGNVPVVGIAGKLLAAFIKKYEPENILTFADIRYSGYDAFYEKIGFKKITNTPPNYYYFHVKSPYDLKHRYAFRKSELSKKLYQFDPVLSEWENMKNNGFDRIWDCGNVKYIWTKP
jgi:hypothetical protein